MKTLKKTAYVLLIALIVAQFFQPEKNEGSLISVVPFLNETNPPENVKEILETTCFDCHSNTTTYPWYNNITPVNYWLESHVKDGKKHLNFSEWTSYSIKKKEHKMDELYEEVEEGEMPLTSYTWTHSEANLTAAQIAEVVAWGKATQAVYQQQLNLR
ncbi:heme-binding domain-containing protein [Polaribacter sp. HL-MS24]|uniref:heme-binding domain-containing protein n=1 Tax=Polaribacter sp. HL-MS24 TaxID=3077735 RepID=UPI002934C88F|nr:heme-binding domain-containing protein [Polaribacter sp. HL-MS24]WOC39466.1 heme-binding domain-containing protein [Polaribacter sp. HL-MS24]